MGENQNATITIELGEYSALIKETINLQKQIKILELKNQSSLANNLCPDHRDKQSGKPCLACIIEMKNRQIEQLKNREVL